MNTEEKREREKEIRMVKRWDILQSYIDLTKEQLNELNYNSQDFNDVDEIAEIENERKKIKHLLSELIN